MSTLIGKRALVTGGSRGIGRATALRLAREGADVAITYERSAERAAEVVAAVEGLGRRGLAIAADSADAAAVAGAVATAAETLGGLDILVNNAGVFRVGTVDSITVDDIDATLAVNVRAVMVATQAAVGRMTAGGRVISVGSSLATRVPWPGLSVYSASKAALIAFTKGAARDLGPRGITVNLVHPGSTNTDMNPADGDHADGQRGVTALGHYGTPDDIAAMIAWLAGPESRQVTGAEFTVDGGANA